MNTIDSQEGLKAGHTHDTLVLRVRYIAARKPLVEEHASSSDTLAGIKPRVLQFFELAEGAAGGGTKTYQFALEGVVLTDLSATLGSLAQGKHEIKLDLVERYEQG